MRNRRLPNLNELLVQDDTSGPGRSLIDPSITTGTTRCYFRNIQDAFLSEMSGATAAVGCVAWLTDMKILEAMSSLVMTSLIVQKEDFLRPDSAGKESLRSAYKGLRMPYDRWQLPHPLRELSSNGDPSWSSVRCVGNHNTSKSPAHPRMHHKFVVFCGIIEPSESEDTPPFIALFPYKVWTGSFNLTYVGGKSLENAVVIEQPEIVRAYYTEWLQVSCLSEPLDWYSQWAAPEHRLGT